MSKEYDITDKPAGPGPGEKARQGLAEQFARIDAIAEENTARVLSAFQKHRVAEGYFAGTTGYGYDDLGRDQLDQIYADLFGTEAALVRIQFVNGTHAITCALFRGAEGGDVLPVRGGGPYDTPDGGHRHGGQGPRLPAGLRGGIPAGRAEG